MAPMAALGLMGLLWGPPVWAQAGDDVGVPSTLAEPPLGDPIADPEEAARRAHDLGKLLRCPVCQALSVADSSSDAARAMQGRIQELLAAGYTEEQVTDYFVDRYGEWVRLEPEATGRHLFLWAAPVTAVLIGAVVVFAGTRRRKDAPAKSPTEAVQAPAADPALDPWRAKVEAELATLAGETP